MVAGQIQLRLITDVKVYATHSVLSLLNIFSIVLFRFIISLYRPPLQGKHPTPLFFPSALSPMPLLTISLFFSLSLFLAICVCVRRLHLKCEQRRDRPAEPARRDLTLHDSIRLGEEVAMA